MGASEREAGREVGRGPDRSRGARGRRDGTGVARLGLLAVLGVVGCGVSFPDEYRIEDLRVLNLRAEPPEIAVFAPPAPGEPLTLDTGRLPSIVATEVRLEAVVAHPDPEARLGYDWVRCGPGLDRVPCEGADRQRLTMAPGPVLELEPVPLLLDSLLAATGGELDPAQLGATLADDPRDLLSGLYAYVNLAVAVESAAVPVDTLQLEATKRVVVYDPRLVATVVQEARKLDPAARQQLAALGLPSLCSNASEAEVEAIFDFLGERRPNQSPRFDRLELDLGTMTPTVAPSAEDPVVVAPGDRVVLSAWSRPGSSEGYTLIDGDCQLQSFREKVAVSWFTDRGDLSRHVTTVDHGVDALGRDVVLEPAETTWTAPSDFDGPALDVRIFAVMRDGRGGSAHRSFRLRVER